MSDDHQREHPAFESTHWSVVLEAGHASSPDRRNALETLCRSYWYPLYAFVRRRNFDAHEAEDLTQEFFARLLATDAISVAEPERGRFRTYLLACLKNFLANEWDKATAKKRGGAAAHIPFEASSGESRYAIDPVDTLTPERLFDREWARALLDRVLSLLRQEYESLGRKEHFSQLRKFLSGRSPDTSYAEVAVTLGISPGAAMVAAHRMRRRYAELLRAEITQTVAEPSQVEDELRSLFVSLSE